MYHFFLTWIVLLVSSLRTLRLVLGLKDFSPMYVFFKFYDFTFTFKSVIHFEIIFVGLGSSFGLGCLIAP